MRQIGMGYAAKRPAKKPTLPSYRPRVLKYGCPIYDLGIYTEDKAWVAAHQDHPAWSARNARADGFIPGYHVDDANLRVA